MKLWLLVPVVDWNPWYDKVFGIVVRAKSEQQARQQASEDHGAEGKEVWLDSTKTTCSILASKGKQETIIVDCRQA